MIQASISAVPHLIVSFLILAVLCAAPTALVAKARRRPWPLRASLAVYLAGIVTVTLLPGSAGLESGQCDTGVPVHMFTSASSLLNVALFAPGACLAVLLFRRPFTVAAAFGCLSGSVELIQAFGHLGRACSLTDVAANAVGAVLGSVVGAIWLRRRHQPPLRPARDLLWGATLAVVAVAAGAEVFHSRIESVDVVAMDDGRHRFVESAVEADEWITTVAKGIYGDDLRVRGTETKGYGDRLKVTAETDRGSVSGWWPQKDLESAWSSNPRGEDGRLTRMQVAAAADEFARKWFPRNIAGSTRRTRPIGDGATRAYVVGYRRYAQGVLLPMRLDLTITGTGRVIGFTARTVEDPALPKVTVDEGRARSLARAETGLPADSTLLLARRIGGTWRPVWLVGSGKRDIVIDAATGERVHDVG
ncbi:VanZ family protein [Streptomyces sp. NPDC003483]